MGWSGLHPGSWGGPRSLLSALRDLLASSGPAVGGSSSRGIQPEPRGIRAPWAALRLRWGRGVGLVALVALSLLGHRIARLFVSVGGDQGWGLPFNHLWQHPKLHPGDCLSFSSNTSSQAQASTATPGLPPSVWQMRDVYHFQSCNFTDAVLVGTGTKVLFVVPKATQASKDVLYFASPGGDNSSLCLEGLRVEVFPSTASQAGPSRDLPTVLWQSDFEPPPAAASGGNKRESCQSRTGWACLQGPRVPSLTPSEHLLEQMTQYRRHWHWCSQQESTEAAGAKLARGEPTICKYILWAPSPEGLGNNMLSLGSAFVHALVTARILLIDSSSVVADLFCEPFPGGLSWLIQHERVEEIGKVHPFEEAKRTMKQFPFDTTRPAPNVLPWYIWIPAEMDSSRFFCPSFNDWAASASALLTVSNMYWAPGLYHIPKFRQLLHLLFPSRAVFPVLRPLIFHPRDHVWESLLDSLGRLGLTEQGALGSGDSSLRGNPGRSESSDTIGTRRLLIAVQHRDFDFWTPVGKAVGEAASCVSRIVSSCKNQSGGKYGVACDASRGGGFDGESGEIRPVHLGREEQFDQGKMGLLVASLAPGFKTGIKERLSNLLDVLLLESDETQKPSNDSGHNVAALRDMTLLSLTSSFILLTPFSTFGYIAAAFSNARPLIISESCEETKVEPCFLLPPRVVRCQDTGKSFKIEFGMSEDINDTTFERCPDIQYLEQYRRARGDSYECCNYGFSLAPHQSRGRSQEDIWMEPKGYTVNRIG